MLFEYLCDSNIRKDRLKKELMGFFFASDIWESNPKLTFFAKIAPRIEVFIKFNIECTCATEPFFHRMCIMPPVIILENIFQWHTCLHILPVV